MTQPARAVAQPLTNSFPYHPLQPHLSPHPSVQSQYPSACPSPMAQHHYPVQHQCPASTPDRYTPAPVQSRSHTLTHPQSLTITPQYYPSPNHSSRPLTPASSHYLTPIQEQRILSWRSQASSSMSAESQPPPLTPASGEARASTPGPKKSKEPKTKFAPASLVQHQDMADGHEPQVMTRPSTPFVRSHAHTQHGHGHGLVMSKTRQHSHHGDQTHTEHTPAPSQMVRGCAGCGKRCGCPSSRGSTVSHSTALPITPQSGNSVMAGMTGDEHAHRKYSHEHSAHVHRHEEQEQGRPLPHAAGLRQRSYYSTKKYRQARAAQRQPARERVDGYEHGHGDVGELERGMSNVHVNGERG